MAVTHLNGREEGSVVCCTKGKSLLVSVNAGEVTCKRCLKIINTPPVVEVEEEVVVEVSETEDLESDDNSENLDELDTLKDIEE